MKLNEILLPEFDQETTNTRKTLERIPDDKFDWRPHEKSMPLGRLSGHLAEMLGWAVYAIRTDSLDLAPPGQPPMQPMVVKSRKEVLNLFDKNRVDARAAIESAGDDHLMKPWSLLTGGKILMTMPRITVIRNFVLNHTVHHRAQLGVYLRLNNIPVPAIYGPSADEGQM